MHSCIIKILSLSRFIEFQKIAVSPLSLVFGLEDEGSLLLFFEPSLKAENGSSSIHSHDFTGTFIIGLAHHFDASSITTFFPKDGKQASSI